MKIGSCQWKQFLAYMDCKKRTKKKVFEVNSEYGDFSSDEALVRNMLADSSITESNGDRSYRNVCAAVDLFCHKMCPWLWCTRGHCKYFNTSNAYNCSKTKPQLCDIYKKYLAKRVIDNATYPFKEDESFIVTWNDKYTIVKVIRIGYWEDEKFIDDNHLAINLYNKNSLINVGQIRFLKKEIYKL